MKGFYIFESETRKEAVDCLELGDIVQSHRLEFASGTMTEEIKMQALVSKETISKCSKDDTYDFEIGALIALMKMCGKEKALKAVEELYFLKEPRGADLDGDILESKVEHMAKKNAELLGENSRLNYIKSCNESTIDSLVNTRDLLINKNNELIEENEKLKSDKDKSWKIYQRNIQKKQDRINALQAQVKASEDDKQKNIEYYEKEIKNLNYRLTCKDISLEAKDKKTSQIKDFGAQIKPLRLPTKREQMWDDILKEGRTPVYVKREDILDFLKECERTGIKWSSGNSPLEAKPFHMSEGYDGVYFFVMTSLDISKTLSTAKRGIKEFRHVMTWWCTACPEEAQAAIHYIRPMRWDLFNQGRFAVKINYDNYKEFYEACEKELGKKPSGFPILGDDVTISICKKDGLFEIFTIEDQKKSGKKIVDWEDVR